MEVSKLSHPPLDGISRLRYAPTPGSSHLLVSSWDSHLRLYDTSTGQLTALQKAGSVVLDCAFLQDNYRAVSGGLDHNVTVWDLLHQQDMVLGRHDAPVRCVEYHEATQQVLTGSWDRTFRLWDPRAVPSASRSSVHVGAKVFAMAVSVDKVIVGGSDRHMHIYDLRQLAAPLERRESSLKNQIRSVHISPDRKSFISSSVEGRVAIEYFDAAENQKTRYAFKCHRVKDSSGREVVHPVNALAFHPKYGTFATGGSDGGVCLWDGYAKKRLGKMAAFSTSVSSLSFNADGTSLAIAISYTFDEGEKQDLPVNEIAIKQISDSEVQPKLRS